MKIIGKLLLTVCCNLWLFSLLNGQCSITNVTAEITACEGSEFDVSITFDYENVSNTFVVVGNGMNYGTFEYNSLPLIITTLAADCEVDYEFIVMDSAIDDCSAFTGLGVVCCDEDQCEITTLDFGPNPVCEDGLIVTEWLIDGVNLGEVGFEIFINNEFQTFVEYSAENWYDFDIEAPETANFVIKVCDNDNANCCIEWELENPCYEPSMDCEITVFEVQGELECAEPDVAYGTWVIGGSGLSETSFQVYLEEDYLWNMEYEENGLYELEFQVANTEFFTVTICDTEECCISSTFSNPCYDGIGDCQITTLDFGPNPVCEDGLIVTEWLIDGVNLSEVGFDIFVNDEFETFVQYDSGNWYDFDIENPGTDGFVLKVCDNDNEDCCVEWDVYNPCYEPPVECEIWDLVAAPSECGGGEFLLQIDFEYVGNTNDFFDYEIIGVTSGFASYADLPLSISINNSTSEELELIINDNDNPDCSAVAAIINPCYIGGGDCEITTLDFGPNPICEDGLILTEWLIDGVNLGEVGFEIFINNEFQTFVEYSSENWYEFDIEAPETANLVIKVCDNDNAECCLEWELENPCYDPPMGCQITLFEVQGELECAEPDVPYGTWVIEGIDLSETSFEVFLEGDYLWTMEYQENGLYSQEFQVENTEYFTVMICDSENEECCITSEFLNPCYTGGGDCEITTLDFGPNPICEDGLIVSEWLIDGVNLGEVGFEIFINNEFQTFVEYNSENWYDFDIEAPETANFVIRVCDNDNAECCIEWELENPCYEESMECELGELDLELVFCDDGVFAMTVDLEFANVSDSFELRGNGIVYGFFAYVDLPVTIEAESDCDLDYEFVVIDAGNPNCVSDAGYGNICCDDNGLIGSVTWMPGDSEDEFYLQFDLDFDGIGCELVWVWSSEMVDTLILGEDLLFGPFDCGSEEIITLNFQDFCDGEFLATQIIDLSDFPCLVGVEDEELLPVDMSMQGSSLIVTSESKSKLIMTIVSINGMIVKSACDVHLGSSSYDLSALQNGLYVVHLVDEKTGFFHTKMIPILE